MKDKQVIGIIGGMGPGASVYMYKILIDFSIRYFGAKNNDDFPEIILHSIPVPDFISSDKDKNVALRMLKEKVLNFNKLDISCLSIACNTAHILLEDLQAASKAPFVTMIEEVVAEIKLHGIKKIGILASQSTIKSKLYQKELSKFHIESIMPNKSQQIVLERIIRNVIKGEVTRKDSGILSKIADDLIKIGAEGIILGCTELPLVFPANYKTNIFNSVEILSMALLRRYYQYNTIAI